MKWHIRLTKDIASMIPQAHPNIPPAKYIMFGALVGIAEYLNMPVFLDLKKMIAPTGVFVGKIGTGKTVSAKAVLFRQHFVFQTSTIIFDVHGEYSPEVRSLGGVVIDMKQNTINPCKRDNNLTVSQKALQLTDMINTIYEFTDIQRAVLIRYIKKGYEKFGDELSFKKITDMISLDLDRRHPDSRTLGALSSRFEVLADEIFGDENSVSLDDVTRGLVCIDVSKIHNNHLRNIVMLSILQHIYNSMLVQQENQFQDQSDDIKLLIMIDEAGRVASSEHSVATKLVKESRKFRIGLFFGIQDIPDIDSKIMSNYGFVFVHQLTNQEYITKIQKDCGFSSEQATRIKLLPVGTAFLKLNFKDASYQSPFVVRVLKEDVRPSYAKQSPKRLDQSNKATIRKIRTGHKVDDITFLKGENKKCKLTENEIKLADSIAENPSFSTIQHYDNIQLNKWQGNKARDSLESKRYIAGRYVPKIGRVLQLTENGIDELRLKKQTRRNGGLEHKAIIETIGRKLESLGHDVVTEYSLGQGKQTDIVADRINAIEVEMKKIQEFNVTKNLKEFNNVIFVCPRLEQTNEYLKQIDSFQLSEEDRNKIHVIDYKAFLNEGTISRHIKKIGEL